MFCHRFFRNLFKANILKLTVFLKLNEQSSFSLLGKAKKDSSESFYLMIRIYKCIDNIHSILLEQVYKEPTKMGVKQWLKKMAQYYQNGFIGTSRLNIILVYQNKMGNQNKRAEKKIIEEVNSPQLKERYERFGGYIDFSLCYDDNIVDYITIEGKRIYFNLKHTQDTLQLIIEQYGKLCKKRFQIEQLPEGISSKTKISTLTSNSQKVLALQELLNLIGSKKEGEFRKNQEIEAKIEQCRTILLQANKTLVNMFQQLHLEMKQKMEVQSNRQMLNIQQQLVSAKLLQSPDSKKHIDYEDQKFQQKISKLAKPHSILKEPFLSGQKSMNGSKWQRQRQVQQMLQQCLDEKKFKPGTQMYNLARNSKQIKNKIKVFNPYSDVQDSSQKQQEQNYLATQCHILEGTKILCVLDQNIKLIEIKVEYLLQMKQKLSLVTFSLNKQTLNFNASFQLEQRVEKEIPLISIKARYQDTFLELIVSGTTRLMIDGKFRKAKTLKQGNKISIYTSFNVRQAQVTEIFWLRQHTYTLYTLHVSPNNNFFANNILVHNDNPISLTIFIFDQNRQPTTKKIKFSANRPLQQIEQLKGMTLTLGGTKLNKNFTSGDYHLNYFSTVFAMTDQVINKTKELIISIRNSMDVTMKQLDLNKDSKQNFLKNFLGIFDSKIVELNKGFSGFIKESPSHLLLTPKSYLQKLHYHHNIQPYSVDISYLKRLQEIPEGVQKAWYGHHQVFPLYMYTLSKYYKQINSFLREKADGPSKFNYHPIEKTPSFSKEQYYGLANSISKCLDELPALKQQQMTVYRGISDIRMKQAFCLNQSSDGEKYVLFTSFTSTSTNKQVAQRLVGNKDNGALLTIKSINGKSIKNCSHFPHQQEVLIQPYTYFLILQSDFSSSPQTMELQEIPFPRTNKPKLIFWVDDEPENNLNIIKKYFRSPQIEVVQVRSTRIMNVLLSDFFGYFNILNKKIVIISDLARKQNGRWNYDAGVDLFDLIYSKYGMSNKAFIYTWKEQYKQEAIKRIKEKGIAKKDWVVSTDYQEISREVLRVFAND